MYAKKSRKTRAPKSQFSVTTKRGEARTETRLVRVGDQLVKTITHGTEFGINKAARRLKAKAA
jgi:hypothetical protein